jgi:hypothetical protein
LLKNIAQKINDTATTLHTEVKKTGTGNMFAYFPQYNEDKEMLDIGVQIDWMVGDLDWLEFSYYSDKYEGNVKGLHRTQLLVSLFQLINATFSHTKGVVDKDTKEVVAKKPKEALDYLNRKLGFKLDQRTVNDYFKLIEYVKKHLSKKQYDELLHIYFTILSHTRADIPYNLQDDWKRLNKKYHYQTKFLPPDSKLLEGKLTFKEYLGIF